MFLKAELNRIYDALRSAQALEECSVIKAYPYVKKPTVLKSTVITVCPAAADMKNVSLGGECLFGSYGFYVDVFIPQQEGTPCNNGFIEDVIEVLSQLEPKRIKVFDLKKEDVLNAFNVKCLVEFSGEAEAETEDDNG